jgi:Fe-S-cluster-containing dehydrogenase component
VNIEESRLNVDLAQCAGCRACELACSFRRTGTFWPAASSIHIGRSNQTAEMSWSLDPTCDLCAGEAGPVCARYCQYDAIVIGGR